MVYGEKKSGIIVGRALKEREEDIVRHGNRWGRGAEYAIADAALPSMSAGATGSMSRFALYDKYLYAVINYRMCIFDLSEPEPVNKGSIGAGNVLMMIADNGLYQYDYSDLSNIRPLSVISIQND